MQLKRRDQELFKKCVEMHKAGDKLRTRMYADECSEIRRIARLVLASQLALEKVIVRLETISHFGDIVTKDMAAIVSLVGEIKGKMSNLIPSIASELHYANTALTNMVAATGQATTFQEETRAMEDETRNVLLEAASIADERMKDQYAELPSVEPSSLRTPVNAFDDDKVGLSEVQNQVYSYAVSQAKRFNIAKCAAELRISEKIVERCLERLVEEGRLSLQRE